MDVPVDRTTIEGDDGAPSAAVTLHVAIVRSTSPDPGDPIVYLEGGPGGGATPSVPLWWTTSRLREHGDVVVFDARGTGYSTPSLDCYEWYVEGVFDPTSACRARFEREGLDMSTHRTRVLAADVVDVVDALGLRRAILFGSSYGTRLALTVLREHPGRWTAAVLDGVYPPNVEHLETQVPAGLAALTGILEACSRDRTCARQLPAASEPHELLASVVASLDARPLVDRYGDPWTGEDLYYLLEGSAYVTHLLGWIPAALDAASRRDARAFTQVVDALLGPSQSPSSFEAEIRDWLRWLTGLTSHAEVTRYLRSLPATERAVLRARAEGLADWDAEGVYDAVECADEVPFNDPVAVRALAPTVGRALSFLVRDALAAFSACEEWDVQPEERSFRDPVATDVPVLLLSGAFDPVTPPWFADRAASTMTQAYLFTFPAMGHGTVDVHPCPTEITLAFLRDPSQAPPATCIDEMPPLRFSFR